MAEMLSRSGFDWLVIDMQHSPLNSSSELLGMVQAISLGQSAPFLRAPWKTQFGAIMAALDAGVEGVIIPMLETADEAEKISRCFRYPPRGDRSWGPWRVAMTDPDYSPEEGDRRALCLVQIETVLHDLCQRCWMPAAGTGKSRWPTPPTPMMLFSGRAKVSSWSM
jgi:4-hydroxy-2-oxoheptanedioate aldolase